MRDKWVRRMIAATIPFSFFAVFIVAGWRDRTLDPSVSGGLIALLGAIVAIFSGASVMKDNEGKEEEEWNSTKEKKK